MRLLLFLSALFCYTQPIHWEKDFPTAQHIAQAEQKPILLVFSGSDWCIPCIRMHNELFASADFSAFADSSLVLFNADFPRLSKNQLSKSMQVANDDLAAKYNSAGKFPFTVLLTPAGKVIRVWEGFNGGAAPAILAEIRRECQQTAP